MNLSFGYITAPTKAEAKDIVTALLEKKLIACANIMPGAESYFWWEDEISKQAEVVILLKTKEKNEAKIIKLVKELHSYECPCVVFLPIISGHDAYLKWLDHAC